MPTETDRASWRIGEWLRAAGHPFTRQTLYNEIHAGRIDARKARGSTIILTNPRAYLDSLPSVQRRSRG
jgi:hypothetical protein